MKLLLLILLIKINLLGGQFLYVSTADNLLVYSINSENGRLKLVSNVSDSRGFKMTKVSPDNKYLYAHSFKKGKTPATIQTFEIKKNGSLKKVAEIASTTGNHAYIDVAASGKYIYALGSNKKKQQVVLAYKLNKGICDSPSFAESPVGHRGKHAVADTPHGKFIYVPHIISNEIHQFKFDEASEQIVPLKPSTVDGPNEKDFPHAHDPRHLTFHPKLNIIYTSQEFGGGVSSWKINSNGTLKLWQTFQNRPADYKFPYDSANSDVILNKASDIHMTEDSQFVYIPNRDNRTRRKSNGPQLTLDSGNDTITMYRVAKDGSLSTPQQNIDTGRHVRCLQSTKNFLYATAVYSGTLHTYKINPSTGKLLEVNLIDGLPHIQNLNSPAWMSVAKP